VSLAPRAGFEPATNRLHLIQRFLYGMDYIIIRSGDCGCEALRSNYLDLLPYGIVSEPSMEYSKAWLLIVLAFTLGVPAIHLIFNTDFPVRLLFRTLFNVTADCSTAELPRNIFCCDLSCSHSRGLSVSSRLRRPSYRSCTPCRHFTPSIRKIAGKALRQSPRLAHSTALLHADVYLT
jgi:hypothetical protein